MRQEFFCEGGGVGVAESRLAEPVLFIVEGVVLAVDELLEGDSTSGRPTQSSKGRHFFVAQDKAILDASR